MSHHKWYRVAAGLCVGVLIVSAAGARETPRAGDRPGPVAKAPPANEPVEPDSLPETAPLTGASPSGPLVLFVPRVGVLVAGQGNGRVEGRCNDAARQQLAGLNLPCGNSSLDISEDVTALVQLDVLLRLGRSVRLGAGLGYQFDLEIQNDRNSAEVHYGDQLLLQGALEAVSAVSSNTDLIARASLGPSFLIEGDDQADARRRLEEACDATPSTSCSISGPLLVGWALGAGGGLVFDAASRRLRVDLMYQYLSQPLMAADISNEPSGATASVENSIQSHRLWVFSGIEL